MAYGNQRYPQAAPGDFAQYSDGDPRVTLYYPDGTPADALNPANAPPPGPRDAYDPFAQLQRMRVMQDPLNPDPTLAPGIPPQASWLADLQSLVPKIPPFQWPAWPALPWGWIAVGAAVIILGPAILAPVPEQPKQRTVAGDTAPGERRRTRRRR